MSGERRKTARLGLAIPVRVQGFRTDGSVWEEFSTTDDVSLGGICFPLAHDVELGHILFLNLALPKRLRQYDLQVLPVVEEQQRKRTSGSGKIGRR